MTQSSTQQIRKPIDSEVRNPTRHTIATQHYQASQPIVQPAPPSAGEISGSPFENEGSNTFLYTFDRMVTASPEPDIPMSSHPVINTPGPSQLSIPQVVPPSIAGKKWPQHLITNPEVAADVAHTLKKLRPDRKCWKCFQKDCPGGTNKKYCPNACVSCNSKECTGKNSRYGANEPCKNQGGR